MATREERRGTIMDLRPDAKVVTRPHVDRQVQLGIMPRHFSNVASHALFDFQAEADRRPSFCRQLLQATLMSWDTAHFRPRSAAGVILRQTAEFGRGIGWILGHRHHPESTKIGPCKLPKI